MSLGSSLSPVSNMRQHADFQKILQLKIYHDSLKKKFIIGKLDGKIKSLIAQKAQQLGISDSTYYRYLRKINSN